jgi:hypothetical protein
MRTLINDEFLAQVEQSRMKMTCEDCVHWDQPAERCSQGFPPEEHRQLALVERRFVFCKLFEES